MWTLFNVFIELVAILLLFYVLFFFCHEVCGVLAFSSEIEPTPLALEDEVLTTGKSGKSLEGASC